MLIMPTSRITNSTIQFLAISLNKPDPKASLAKPQRTQRKT
jgi:hypothetical protein